MAETLVCFHAHPDDETIVTGGVIARAVDEGHRVVLVFATRGEHGEVADGVLDAGEELWQRRVEETRRAASILGAQRVEFLGYRDSGMKDTPENDAPGSFWSADVEEAASRLAALLADERADVVTVYDERGAYGHPDHIQVHRVGVRAAQLARTNRLYAATINRDYLLRLMRERRHEMPELGDVPDPDTFDLGVDERLITTTVDVTSVLDRKRAAMAAHASQISETSFFLTLPKEAFRDVFGQEWFIRLDRKPAAPETWLLPES